jgi:hypothetical protein
MKPLEVLTTYLPYFPMYLAWLVGAILALVRWHRHPRVSLVMLIATALFIFGLLLQVASFAWLMHQASVGGWSSGEIAGAFGLVAVVESVLHTAAYALLLTAVFGWRGGRPHAVDSEEDFPEDTAPRMPPGA